MLGEKTKNFLSILKRIFANFACSITQKYNQITLKFMNQKTIIAILGVAVIILLGTTIYFATIRNVSQPVPTPTSVTTQPASTTAPIDETANWKVYTNAKYGFEMQVPQDWNVKDEEKIDFSDPKETINQSVISFSVQNKGEEFDTLYVMITPTENIKKCDNMTPLCNSGSDVKEKNGFTFGFVSGYAGGGGGTPEYYAKMEEKLKDSDTVIKSFKFTK